MAALGWLMNLGFAAGDEAAVVVPDVAGAEGTLPLNRAHGSLPVNRAHGVANYGQAHGELITDRGE